MVELLIRAGADLHIRNGKALTAVGSATNNGHAETVLKLVSHGAAWRKPAGHQRHQNHLPQDQLQVRHLRQQLS